MKKLLLTLIVSSVCVYAFALTSITTKKVNGTPFCGGAAVSVSFTVDAPANAGNVFTAQLSAKNGSFTTPVNIGTLSSTGSGTISATIPLGTVTGSKYKIRVIASNPAVIGIPCPNAIKINPAPTALATSGITACAATATWTGTATASSYKVQYKKTSSGTWSNTIDVGLATTYTFTALASGTSYDFQVRSSCSNGEKSSWVKTTASTLSCPTPTGLIVTAIGITTSSLNWNDAVCASDYSFRYRIFGASVWIYKHPITSNIDLTGLQAATLYEAQVATRCTSTDSSAFTASAMWETNYFRAAGNTDLVSEFNVFPNPSNGTFTVQFNSSDASTDVEISVQNMYGQVVFHSEKSPVAGLNEEKISLNNAAAGVYFVTIKSGGKELRESLLVK